MKLPRERHDLKLLGRAGISASIMGYWLVISSLYLAIAALPAIFSLLQFVITPGAPQFLLVPDAVQPVYTRVLIMAVLAVPFSVTFSYYSHKLAVFYEVRWFTLAGALLVLQSIVAVAFYPLAYEFSSYLQQVMANSSIPPFPPVDTYSRVISYIGSFIPATFVATVLNLLFSLSLARGLSIAKESLGRGELKAGTWLTILGAIASVVVGAGVMLAYSAQLPGDISTGMWVAMIGSLNVVCSGVGISFFGAGLVNFARQGKGKPTDTRSSSLPRP